MTKQTQIRALVDDFVNSLDRLIRQSVWETAQETLGFGGSAPQSGARLPSAPKAATTAATPRTPARPSKRGLGQKRDPNDIAKLTDRLLAAITAKPGQRMEHLKKELGVDKAELLVPVARLLDGKKVRRTGEKRATQYYPAK